MPDVVLAAIAPITKSQPYQIWVGNTIYAQARFVDSTRRPRVVSQVDFIWRHPATGFEIILPATADPATPPAAPAYWRGEYVAELPGYWVVAARSQNPKIQLDWMGFMVLLAPGQEGMQDGALWLSQDNTALLAGSGLLITGRRIDQFESLADPAGAILPVIRPSDGKTFKVLFEDLVAASVLLLLGPIREAITALEAADEIAAQQLQSLEAADQAHAEALETHAGRLDELENAEADTALAISGLRERADALEESVDALELASAQHADKLTEAADALEQLTERTDSISDHVDTVDGDVQRISGEVEGLQQTSGDQARAITALGQQDTELGRKIAVLAEAADALKLVVDALDLSDEGQLADLSALTAAIANHKNRIEALEVARSEQSDALDQLSASHTALSQDVVQQAEELADLRQDVTLLQQDISQADSRTDGIEQRVAAEEQASLADRQLLGRLDADLDTFSSDLSAQVGAITQLQRENIAQANLLIALAEANEQQNSRLAALESDDGGASNDAVQALILENARQQQSIDALLLSAQQASQALQALANADAATARAIAGLSDLTAQQTAQLAQAGLDVAAAAAAIAALQASQADQDRLIARQQQDIAALRGQAEQLQAANDQQDTSLSALGRANEQLNATVAEQARIIQAQQGAVVSLQNIAGEQTERLRAAEFRIDSLLLRIEALELAVTPEPAPTLSLDFTQPANSGYLNLMF